MKLRVLRLNRLQLTLLSRIALLAALGTLPGAAQDVTQFISTTTNSINAFQSTLAPASSKVILSSNLVYANGAFFFQSSPPPLDVLLQYVEGLKASGAQRVDLNPAVTTINDPDATAIYDAVVAHIRALGMQLALNPQVVGGELGLSPTFQDFQTMAMTTYPALAARYQPENFVIVHEPTTMNARLGVDVATQDWNSFIQTVAPAIKLASPHTRVGAGGFYSVAENAYFQNFVTIPALDFMTIDIYDDNNFPALNGWIQLAHTAIDLSHPNGKGIYIEETWAPKFLPDPLPAGWQSNPLGLSAYTLVGDCNLDFQPLDVTWLQAMLKWASATGMEAVTPFTTQAFFYYYQGDTTQGTATYGYDQPLNPIYIGNSVTAIQNGQLTDTAKAYQSLSSQYGIPLVTSASSASFQTLSSVFTPSCQTDPSTCFKVAVAAPDALMGGFGTDLANTILVDGGFPSSLGGTTAKLVDSSNTSYNAQLFFVAPGQVNYYIPGNVKTGPATLTIKSGDGAQSTGIIQINSVNPGIYTAYQNGQGPAAAVAVCAGTCSGWPNPGNGVYWQYTFVPGCLTGNCGAPISWGDNDVVVVELFGTGIRHVSALSAVSASINGQNATVQYAGASGYTGEDQINVLIPQGLRHAGTVNLVLTVDGQTANTVTLDLN